MNLPGTLRGVLLGLAAYGMWGFFPLFFRQLSHVPPLEVLLNRALWSCGFVMLVITLRRGWPAVRRILREPRALLLLGASALLIGANWLIFIWAVANRQVVASSLGYFITPLVSVLLGTLVLGERLEGKERVAVALAAAALANEVWVLGALPWISLSLGVTFALYGLVRKHVAADALTGLLLETLWMLPAAAAYGVWQLQLGHNPFVGPDRATSVLLALSGVVTALPLLAFGAAARRLNLVTLGMLMYINPSMQLATAALLFGEPLRPGQWLSFSLIWLGLAWYSWGAWEKYRSASPAPAGA